MSETDYEYLRMRAELLGLPEPEKPVIEPGPPVQLEEEISCEDDLNLDADGEKFTRTSGGLDEIGNILQTTQKKINRFKTVFGSVTSLLKGRGSTDSSTENLSSNSNINESCANEKPKNNDQDENDINTSCSSTTISNTRGSAKQVDVESMLSSHIKTLDSMVYKADEINAKMNHQNKQMRNFINK